MQFWALIVDSFRESRDKKTFWLLLAITVFIASAMMCVGIKADRITFIFGLWEIETTHFNPFSNLGQSAIAGLVVYLLMDLFLGWVGVLLMIIATAGAFPALMERGAIDVLVSKPLSRSKLFLYKYLSTMVFVFVQASFFVGLTFLVMGFRWGVWIPGYLLSIPLLVLLFSYVYCVPAWVAVRTGSTVAAVLVGIGAWIAYVTPSLALAAFEENPQLKRHERFYRAVTVLSWIPPKTDDIPYFAARLAHAGTSVDIFPAGFVGQTGTPRRDAMDRARSIEERELMTNPFLSIGSSLLFEAVVVLWAMWIFARKDY